MVVANDGGAGSGTTRVAQFRSNFPASIDGLKIMGGRHDGFPNNRDPVTGAPNGQTATVETQGGGIYVNAQAHSLQITNDVIQGNSGAYGGGIRLGTPNIGSNQNDNIRIAFNRIDQNGGTNLAGGVGIFAGATNYRIDHNTLCGEQLGRVRRRHQPLRPLERRQDRPQPHLVQPQLRRGRRGLRGQ